MTINFNITDFIFDLDIDLSESDQLNNYDFKNFTDHDYSTCFVDNLDNIADGIHDLAEKSALLKEKNANIKEFKDNIGNLSVIADELLTKEKMLQDEIKKLDNLAKQTLDNKANENLLKAIDFYENQMGIKAIRKQDGAIEISLTLTNGKIGSFIMNLDENEKYIVSNCTPNVDNLKNLLENFNLTQNSSAFIKNIRSEFDKILNN